MVRRILFADNDPDFLEQRALSLQEHGFEVLTAGSPQAAERALRDELVHVAILDIRLTNDTDERDVSGLLIARKPEFQEVPKIILTGFPTVSHVREALRAGLEGTSPAVDFLAKRDGVDAMLTTIEEVFARHVQVNWALRVEAPERSGLTVAYVAGLIGGDTTAGARVSEIDDLFRRLFIVEQQIRIDRLLWHRAGRVALAVFAFVKDNPAQSLVVVCGSVAHIRDETRRFDEFAPKSPGVTDTVVYRTAMTPHFGARAYLASGCSLDKTSSLRELYQTAQEKVFGAVLATLYETTLAHWSQARVIADESFDSLCRTQLRLTTDSVAPGALDARVDTLARQSPTLDVRIERTSDGLRVTTEGQAVDYPDPCRMISRAVGGSRPATATISPGWVSGDNVLTDRDHRAWLTDFGDAGLAPTLWSVATLEAALRFDWANHEDLPSLQEFDTLLAVAGFGRIEPGDVDAPLRKQLRAVQAIRRLAGPVEAPDAAEYQRALVFHAIKRLSDFDPAERLMPAELSRLVHVLTAAAVICARISSQGRRGAAPAQPRGERIRIDKAGGVVLVDGRNATMSRQSYELLCYLHDHANRLCAKRDVFHHVFRVDFDESDESHIGRLTTAIRRLRERIEADPERPHFLVTETGRGYRLVC